MAHRQDAEQHDEHNAQHGNEHHTGEHHISSMREWVLWPEELPKPCHRKLWAAPSGDAIHHFHHPGGCTEVHEVCGHDWEGDSPPEGMAEEWQQNTEED